MTVPKIRSSLAGDALGLTAPPSFDHPMMAGQQNLRYVLVPPHAGPCIVGILQEPPFETLVRQRVRVAYDPWQ